MPGPVIRRLGTVDYQQSWTVQRELHQQVVAGSAPDTVLLLVHPPVYTAGRRTEPAERPTDGTPVIEVDRGGKITWHGPGQLVGYPVVAVPRLAGVPGVRDSFVDVVAHVRRIEAALVAVCADFGVPARPVPGRTGVWTADGTRKIAAIGIRVSRGVAMHGFAVNCDCDLGWYDRIIPCGISDAGVTSLSAVTGRTVTVADVMPAVEHRLFAALAPSASTRAPARV